MKNLHIITFRGTIDLAKWNNLLRYLYASGIKYATESHLSPTRDDAGLHRYYERVIFLTDKDIHFDFRTNRSSK